MKKSLLKFLTRLCSAISVEWFMKKNYFLLAILSLAFFLRVWQLDKYPSGFHIDEAQIGYNAFSILKTFKDENGQFLPLHTSFFNEARPMLTVYLTVPWVSLFGLNIFSTRLTNGLLGVIAVYLTYELVKRLFNEKKLALISSLLLAISPWHIILSRSSADGAIGLTFLLLSGVLTISWLNKKNNISLLLIYIAWMLTYFSYTGVRPLIFLHGLFILGYLLWKKDNNSALKIGSLLIIFTLIPVYLTSLSGEALARFKQIGNITPQAAEARLLPSFLEDSQNQLPIIVTRAFHNKIENSVREFLGEYFKYLNFDFLFLHGGFPKRFVIPEQQLQYWSEIPFFLAGLYMILKGFNFKKGFILFWFLGGALPAALTLEDSPNMQRAIYMLPGVQIITSIGFLELYDRFKKLKLKHLNIYRYAFALFVVMLAWESSRFAHQFVTHQPLHQPWDRNVEFPQIVSFVNQNQDQFDEINISKLGTEPYYFFLFYNKIDPINAQELVKQRNVNGSWKFGKILFNRDSCPIRKTEQLEENIIYGNKGECEEISGAKVIKEIRRPDNTMAMKFLIKE